LYGIKKWNIISCLIKYFKKNFICALDLLLFSLFGKGTIDLYTSLADFSFFFSPFYEVFGLEFADVEA